VAAKTDDWALAAAQDIGEGSEWDGDDTIVEKIKKHCPFKPDVAYMPVPRCDGCRHWDHECVTGVGTAECFRPEMSAKVDVTPLNTGETININFQMRTKADFGCTLWEGK